MKSRTYLPVPKISQVATYPYWNKIIALAQGLGIRITEFVINTYTKEDMTEKQAIGLQNFALRVLNEANKAQKI